MRIAGGMFGLGERLDSVATDKPTFMHEPIQMFLSARCAIQHLVTSFRPPQVWMPSYLCCSMLEAVDQRITELMFFPVAADLKVRSLDWLDLLVPRSLVVMIDYFGFPIDTQLMQSVHARGAYLVEDASQALLSTHVGLHSDFVVYSPRKILGVPDGGILQYKRGHMPEPVQLLSPPYVWWLKALESCVARREFDKFSGERQWFSLFREVEATYPLGPFRMSELSEVLLQTAFDYSSIAQARRANFLLLSQRLEEHALFRTLDVETVPLGFPIVVENRDVVRQALFEYKVFPPIHWMIAECVPPDFAGSHKLSSDIMTIPCDQRLQEEDIQRIVDVLLAIMGRL